MTASETPLEAYGLSVTGPAGWDARIYLPPADAESGEVSFPIIHAATIPLDDSQGDFGTGIVDLLGPSDAFIVVSEEGDDVEAPLFSHNQRVPTNLDASKFSPAILRRQIAGQAGCQFFFSASGRPFGLYVVVGSYKNVDVILPEINECLESISVSEAG
jgi:hypothetical protein